MATVRATAAAMALTLAGNAQASFHLMQIEQAIGGVNDDVSQQAVQLRMRAASQNLVQFSRLRVFDAAGGNPVLLVDFASQVANGAVGDRVLVASAEFAARQDPAPDFLMANIPPAYLAGGRLTFESDGGSVLFSLCWGSYTGPSTGTTDNDADGQFAPCVPGPLPSGGLSALRFGAGPDALSSDNATDFLLTGEAAVFTSNARAGATLVLPPFAARGGDCDDTDPDIHPGAAEIPGNGRDDDCDGLADEGPGNVPSDDPSDTDGDGTAIAQGDCNDHDTAVRPGLAEFVGDRIDNDCDGFADEGPDGTPSADGVDHDGDGHAMFGRVFASGFEP